MVKLALLSANPVATFIPTALMAVKALNPIRLTNIALWRAAPRVGSCHIVSSCEDSISSGVAYESALDPVILHIITSNQIVHLLLEFSGVTAVVDLDRYKDRLCGMSIEPMINPPENILQLRSGIQNYRTLKSNEPAPLASTS
jgi:hypothetical protein